MEAGGSDELTDDAFLGGRVRILQPRRGHRSGLEAVMIAAACPARPGETVIDMGAGAGAAAICLLARVPGTRAILVEADPAMAELASSNLERNGLAGRAEVRCIRIGARATGARHGENGEGARDPWPNAVADHAISNPPFRDPSRHRASPDRAAAHLLSVEALDDWLSFAAGAVRARGTLTLVHEAEALPSLLPAWKRRFGGPSLLPLHPRPGKTARRVLLQGRRGGREALALLPSLMLHEGSGHGFSDTVEAVLRHAAALALTGDPRDTSEALKP